MKKIKILYWVFTGLFLFMMAGSAIPDIMSNPSAVKGIHDGLGYPLYFVPFIGIAKALGALAILLPISRRIKEWAFAGLFFDLIGATVSIIAVGTPAANYLFMALPLTLAVLSYVYFRKMADRQPQTSAKYSEETVSARVAF
ncbi:DoxX family protein [Puia sp.]|jgi:hypothetical protein|uniref:DoxX family protein n=1 Tax=Puia sp. TaxID=2045100 RepID=UPI002F3F24B6